MTPEIIEKAHDLLEQNRVALVSGYEGRAAVVNGFHGWWTVRAYSDGLECDCPAGQAEWCSHRLAAAAVWFEAMQDAFNPAVAA